MKPTIADIKRAENLTKASLYQHDQIEKLEALNKLLKAALKSALLVLEEDTVPSPFVEGARNRMVKTIEMIMLAL